MLYRLGAIAVIGLLLAAGCSSDDSESADAEATATPSSVTTASGCSDEVVDGPEAVTIRTIVEGAAADLGLTSVVYAVSRDGDLIAAGGVGESLPGTPATEDMHFRVGNVAYAYLGTLLLLMAESGDVSLDDTVAELLPEVDVPNADRVTLEMLIRNTSGWPDHVRTDEFLDSFLADPFQSYTVEEMIDFGMSLPPWYEPGEAWSYSHTGHVVLGEALAAAAGQPLDQLLTERVIVPMGLADTAPALDVALPAPVLHSYSTERDVIEETTFWNPSWQTAPGSVVTSTVCDLVISAAAIGSGALLNEESYETLVAPVTVELGPVPESCPEQVCRPQRENAYYALGVRVVNDWVAQAPLFGGAGGVHAYLPDQDLAIAVQAVTGPETGEIGNPADLIWAELAAELAPDNPTTP